MTEVSGYGTLHNKYTTSWSMTDKGESENKPNKSVELTQQTTRPHTVTCKNILIYDINSLNINRILCTTYIDTVASTYYVLYNDLQGGCSGYKIFVRSLEKRHDN